MLIHALAMLGYRNKRPLHPAAAPYSEAMDDAEAVALSAVTAYMDLEVKIKKVIETFAERSAEAHAEYVTARDRYSRAAHDGRHDAGLLGMETERTRVVWARAELDHLLIKEMLG